MLYDFTHRLNNDSPVYPGVDSPRFTPSANIDENGYRETHFEFHSHLGTHIDAPAHMLKHGKFLDQMDISVFCGRAFIISTEPDVPFIEKNILEPFKNRLEKAEFVLFKTGWSKFWKDKKYFGDFPVLTLDAVKYLLGFSLKGIGVDTISADPVSSTDYKNHRAIFEKGLLIIENLNFPKNMKETTGEFFCFPVSFENADGSPVRAVFKTKDATDQKT